MDTDALPIPSWAAFSGKNRTNAISSNDNRSITVTLKNDVQSQTVVAAISPLGSVAFILDASVYSQCKNTVILVTLAGKWTNTLPT